jgi:hypothetical protein
MFGCPVAHCAVSRAAGVPLALFALRYHAAVSALLPELEGLGVMDKRCKKDIGGVVILARWG